MTSDATPFESPPSLRVTVELPNAGIVTGMGVPDGVTLIVGGEFHGKSTLLGAIERGVYNHCPGDGRELAVTDPHAFKVRAEDGRSVAGVDISPFISRLPRDIDTTFFSTNNASGSTSMAANIVEALEAGARVLLIDEDTSTTNFMIRDHRMQELVAREMEPITPFVDKVGQLREDLGISTILVMGGSCDYFDAADTVIAMEEYRPRDVSGEAADIARRYRSERTFEGGLEFGSPTRRYPDGASLDPRRGRRPESVKSSGVKAITFGREEIDVSAVEQIVHPGQLRSIGATLLKVRQFADGKRSLGEILDRIEDLIKRGGLDGLTRQPMPDLAGFKRLELAAVLNRVRTLKVIPQGLD